MKRQTRRRIARARSRRHREAELDPRALKMAKVAHKSAKDLYDALSDATTLAERIGRLFSGPFGKPIKAITGANPTAVAKGLENDLLSTRRACVAMWNLLERIDGVG